MRMKRHERSAKARTEIFLRGTVSLAILLAGLFVILSGGYDPAVRQWAYGALAMLLGYWLKRSDPQ